MVLNLNIIWVCSKLIVLPTIAWLQFYRVGPRIYDGFLTTLDALDIVARDPAKTEVVVFVWEGLLGDWAEAVYYIQKNPLKLVYDGQFYLLTFALTCLLVGEMKRFERWKVFEFGITKFIMNFLVHVSFIWLILNSLIIGGSFYVSPAPIFELLFKLFIWIVLCLMSTSSDETMLDLWAMPPVDWFYGFRDPSKNYARMHNPSVWDKFVFLVTSDKYDKNFLKLMFATTLPFVLPLYSFSTLYICALTCYGFDHTWCNVFEGYYTGTPYAFPIIFELDKIDTLHKVINLLFNCPDGLRFYTSLQVAYSLVYYSMFNYYTTLLSALIVGQIIVTYWTYVEVQFEEVWNYGKIMR